MKDDTKNSLMTLKSVEIGGKLLSLEFGRFAGQANGAVLAKYGDTVVLVTAVAAGARADLDYFPLSVEYIERLYAGGRIKGSRWVKREGRPSDEEILTARLIDRSIRPLFPKAYKNEVQIIATVLSVDGENNPDIPALAAASAALTISDIPWNGPMGAVRLGFIPENGHTNFIINPTNQEVQYSDMDLVVTTDGESVIMLEGGANQVEEKVVIDAIEAGKKEVLKIIKLIKELQKAVGQPKQVVVAKELDQKLYKAIEKDIKKDLMDTVKKTASKKENGGWLDEIKIRLTDEFGVEKKGEISEIVDDIFKHAFRDEISEKKARVDGRKIDEVRPISAETSVLPRTHGSAFFKRGQTQALSITTLGSTAMEQLIESSEGEESKRYIHHYNFPPYSVGEVGRIGSPSRREIGHGALAERALEPVIPGEDLFPYTIRVVSEIMSSNGSTSMASVCGSTLSLMDAGVPILAPVAGIAIGKIGKTVLTDIIGLEDFNGDMDFKVAGTTKGITAIQLDVKALDLTADLIVEVFERAKKARLQILETMLKVLPTTRGQISQYAPKIEVVQIPVDKIGQVIGPSGKNIKAIVAQTGAMVDISDDGKVSIASPDQAAVERAKEWITGMTREVQPGEVFEGVVKKIMPFGAFVEFLPGKQGLVHVSKLSNQFVQNPEDVVQVDQKVKVKVVEIDKMGRINLTMVF
jgi:polyribonucleotide nucleotidyltransferase